MDGWMNQAYSRLSTTHGHITDCKLVCMYLTRLVLVRPAASLCPIVDIPLGLELYFIIVWSVFAPNNRNPTLGLHVCMFILVYEYMYKFVYHN